MREIRIDTILLHLIRFYSIAVNKFAVRSLNAMIGKCASIQFGVGFFRAIAGHISTRNCFEGPLSEFICNITKSWQLAADLESYLTGLDRVKSQLVRFGSVQARLFWFVLARADIFVVRLESNLLMKIFGSTRLEQEFFIKLGSVSPLSPKSIIANRKWSLPKTIFGSQNT